MTNNFRFWHDEIADMPMQENGRWYDAETGIAYRADHNYAGEQRTKPRAALSQKALDARAVAKAFGGKALTGTAKQKNWAEKIRADILRQVTLEQAKKLCSEGGLGKKAVFWIDNRRRSPLEFGQFIDKQKELLKTAYDLRDEVIAGDESKRAAFEKAADVYNAFVYPWTFGKKY